MQSAITITLSFILFELFSLELCGSQNHVSSVTWNLFKISLRNFMLISIYIRRHAECKNHNSCIYTFWIISLGTLSVHSITWKHFKISSKNFIWKSINISRREKGKNHNSCIYTFRVITLGIPLINIYVCWMYNTIWHQKWGDIYSFVEKQILVLIYKSPWWFLPSFKSIGFSVQEKKWKIDFPDSRHGSYLGFPIGMILVNFGVLSPLCFLPSFESTGLSVQQKKRKIDFQDGRHGSYLGFPIETISAISDLQVIPKISTQVQVNWPFGSGEKVKNRFSRWLPSWISDQKDFIYFFFFWSTKSQPACCFLSSFEWLLAFWFRRRREK